MLSLPKNNEVSPVYHGSGVCLSTDEKPVGNVENGSQLIEMDTGKVYLYDAENSEWKEFT